MRFTCPHCQSKARIRSSRKITPLSYDYYVQCDNVECGFTFQVMAHIQREISPSSIPNPDIILPGKVVEPLPCGPTPKTKHVRNGVPVGEK